MFFGHRITKWIAAAIAAIMLGGGIFGFVAATSGGPGTATAANGPAITPSQQGQPAVGNSGGGTSNARSGPAAGGSTGTVSSLSTSGFTLTTAAGQKVTVKETSSTAYQQGTTAASASAIATGQPVLVLGTTNGSTITASQVIVQPPSSEAPPSWAGSVVPFQRGAQSASKQVGQIPASYTQGSGTIVSGTTASKATRAALAVYPGGIVDRVVQLSNGQYEVHYIGVNWPHHIFVSSSFQVVGAG